MKNSRERERIDARSSVRERARDGQSSSSAEDSSPVAAVPALDPNHKAAASGPQRPDSSTISSVEADQPKSSRAEEIVDDGSSRASVSKRDTRLHVFAGRRHPEPVYQHGSNR